jgi:hypothetical protein
MKSSILRVLIISLSVLFLTRGVSVAQYEDTAGANPPIAQPLVREGDLALKLSEALGLGTHASEEEAESALNAIGIAPRNGWLSDYPVTPDIAGEVQASVGEASDSGTLNLAKDTALSIFQNVMNGYNLSVRAAEEQGGTPGSVYIDPTAVESYYNTEGPPLVTYYAPPPSQAYLYTWVPYPFWWWDFWFPGFFVQTNFNVRVRPHEHWHEREHDVFIRNQFRDSRTDRIFRVDPTNRFHRENFDGRGDRDTRGFGASRPFFGAQRPPISAQRPHARRPPVGVQSPPAQRPPISVQRPPAGAQRPSFVMPRPAPGNRSSAFERFGNSRFEGRASDRGFQSRSRSGQIPSGRGQAPGKGFTDKGDSGQGGFRDSGGGAFHGRGRR